MNQVNYNQIIPDNEMDKYSLSEKDFKDNCYQLLVNKYLGCIEHCPIC